jgi:L-arabinonolactonase
MSIRIEQLGTARFQLGEGPLWDIAEGALYGVDVPGRTIWRYRPGRSGFETWSTPDVVSSLALRDGGGAVITLAKGFHSFDFDTGLCEPIGEAIETDLDTRFNDGKVDRKGRFVAGTMHNRIRDPLGSIYRLGTDGALTKLDTGFICSNGPCWSPDGRTFYFTDTIPGRIYAYEHDPDSGAIDSRRVLVDFRALGIDGAPDGCTVDAEGYLWSALCLAGRIARIAPDGTLERMIDMPVEYVTSVMFGGPRLDTIYVTSLSIALRGRPPKEPNAGALFAVSGLGAVGIPEPRYTG